MASRTERTFAVNSLRRSILRRQYLSLFFLTSTYTLCSNLQATIGETIIIDNKWTVDGEVTDRSVLSDELATFCAKYPIYRVKKVKDTMTSTRIQTDGE